MRPDPILSRAWPAAAQTVVSSLAACTFALMGWYFTDWNIARHRVETARLIRCIFMLSRCQHRISGDKRGGRPAIYPPASPPAVCLMPRAGEWSGTSVGRGCTPRRVLSGTPIKLHSCLDNQRRLSAARGSSCSPVLRNGGIAPEVVELTLRSGS